LSGETVCVSTNLSFEIWSCIPAPSSNNSVSDVYPVKRCVCQPASLSRFPKHTQRCNQRFNCHSTRDHSIHTSESSPSHRRGSHILASICMYVCMYRYLHTRSRNESKSSLSSSPIRLHGMSSWASSRKECLNYHASLSLSLYPTRRSQAQFSFFHHIPQLASLLRFLSPPPPSFCSRTLRNSWCTFKHATGGRWSLLYTLGLFGHLCGTRTLRNWGPVRN